MANSKAEFRSSSTFELAWLKVQYSSPFWYTFFVHVCIFFYFIPFPFPLQGPPYVTASRSETYGGPCIFLLPTLPLISFHHLLFLSYHGESDNRPLHDELVCGILLCYKSAGLLQFNSAAMKISDYLYYNICINICIVSQK